MGITDMGYAVYCDNCGQRHAFALARSLGEALLQARDKGMVVAGNSHFCSQNCHLEHQGKICLHVYSRSNPTVCVKCGEKR